MNEELGAIDTVDKAIGVVRKGRFAELTFRNGITLKLKPVPPLLMQAIGQQFKTPDPPKVFIEEKGRDEPNPNDHEYLRTLKELEEKQEKAVQDLIMGTGTEVIFVPEGYYGPEEDGWVESVEFAADLAGVHLELDRSSPTKRYLCWLRFYAMETAAEIALAEALPLQLAGIREGEIQEALESFHGVPERGTNPSGEPEAGNSNGDKPNRASRRIGSRNRRAGSSAL